MKNSKFGWSVDDVLFEDDDLAQDEVLAYDRAMLMSIARPGIEFAFDRKRAGSVRDFDADGRLHVEISNISKATVNPYLGKEIPKWRELKLEPDKIYNLLRCPIELERAAPSFNNLPLLDEHVPVSAASHRPEHVIGSTGTDSSFEKPHLKNSLVIWADRGIKAIESEKKKELSSAYRYRADMTPGVFDGVQYDGVMRDIIGNHVALVEEGRAGSDVVVGDSQNPTITRRTATMKKAVLTHRASVARGALMVFLQPQLGMDAKINLSPVLKDVTAANFKKKRPAITSAIHTMLGDLAQDGSIKAGLDAVLDMIEGMPKAEDADLEFKDKAEDEDVDDEGAEDENSGEELGEEEKKKKAAADKKAKDAKRAKDKKLAADKDPNENPEDNETGTGHTAADEENEKAMDAAIKAGIAAGIKEERKRIDAINIAKEFVRPRVGNLTMAFDSAVDVYRQALKIATGKEAPKTADADTLRFAFDALPPAARTEHRQTTIAMDAASTGKPLAERSPTLAKNLSRIGRM